MGLVQSGVAISSESESNPGVANFSNPGVPESMVFRLYCHSILAPSICHVVYRKNHEFRMATIIGLDLCFSNQYS